MYVQVVHRLATVVARIDYQTVAILQLLGDSQLCCKQKKPSKKICLGNFPYIGDMILGQNQNMCWRLRVDIKNCKSNIVLGNYLRRNLAVYDFAKYAVHIANRQSTIAHRKASLESKRDLAMLIR